jgi:hypothetical protein
MKYRRPSRLRRLLKWAGLVVCVLVLAAWSVSLTRHVGVGWGDRRVSLGDGQVRLWRLRTLGMRFGGWHVYYDVPQPGSSYSSVWVQRSALSDGGTTILHVPLWLILLATAIPMAVLWRRGRRPPKGCCQGCGYNLIGNVSGICPECGESV